MAAASGVPMYSGPIEVEEIDPVYHSNEYTTFELKDLAKTYLPNLQLTGVGYTLASGSFPLHESLGVLAGIKRIEITANATRIQTVPYFNRWALFMLGTRNSNSTQMSLQNPLWRSSTGYAERESGGGYYRILDSGPVLEEPNATDTDATTATGTVELQDCLSFLEHAEHLHVSAMGTITIRIYWETKLSKTIVPLGTVTKILPPRMTLQFSRDPAYADMAIQQLQSTPITFPDHIHDLFYAPAAKADSVGGTKIQKVPANTKAFNKTFLNRVFFINEPQDVDIGVTGARSRENFGVLCSNARFQGVDNVFINGERQFGMYGIDTEARRAAILHETFPGGHSHAPGMELSGLVDYGGMVVDEDGRFGTQEVTGFMVSKVVTDFQIEWQRTVVDLGPDAATWNVPPNVATIVHVFGEVYRTRMPNGSITDLATDL